MRKIAVRAVAPFTTKECGTATVVVWRSALLPCYGFAHETHEIHEKKHVVVLTLCSLLARRSRLRVGGCLCEKKWNESMTARLRCLFSPARSQIKEQVFVSTETCCFKHTRAIDTRYLFFTMKRIYHRRAGLASAKFKKISVLKLHPMSQVQSPKSKVQRDLWDRWFFCPRNTRKTRKEREKF